MNVSYIKFTVLGIFLHVSLLISAQDKPYVVMLSLDGFRWDYTEKVNTPNLDYIAKNGVKAESLKPSFPSKTFPNHYTIATGLYPDHHGIVANSFYDPNAKREYKISDRQAVEDGYFYGGEPIWVSAEKQNVTAASYFWVGSEAPIQGIRPTYWKKYDHGFPFAQSIDTVIHWLQLPEKERPHLILFYSSEPDGKGHYSGPEDPETRETIAYLDSMVGVFIKKVNALRIADQLNFIVVSDHGMTQLDPTKTVYLSDFIQQDWFERIIGWNPVFFFQPKSKFRNEAIQALHNIDHVKVWKKNELPEKWHYGTNDRILDFVLVGENGWQIKMNRDSKLVNGDHGYDNDFMDMHGIFYAMGPAFKINHEQPTFESIQIYNLICQLLDLMPVPNDGDLKKIDGMLSK
jgi:predicted AlkP superfamily pyrophosphatase or phosphodiesterase